MSDCCNRLDLRKTTSVPHRGIGWFRTVCGECGRFIGYHFVDPAKRSAPLKKVKRGN